MAEHGLLFAAKQVLADFRIWSCRVIFQKGDKDSKVSDFEFYAGTL
jgi:hypothetical protein